MSEAVSLRGLVPDDYYGCLSNLLESGKPWLNDFGDVPDSVTVQAENSSLQQYDRRVTFASGWPWGWVTDP
jgi:hypothetical protein